MDNVCSTKFSRGHSNRSTEYGNVPSTTMTFNFVDNAFNSES